MSRSFGVRLAFLIAGAAVAAVFLVVVPQLQARLEHQRLTQLERVAPTFTPVVRGAIAKEIKAPKLDELVRSIADRSDAEVTLAEIQRQGGAPPKFGIYSNSRMIAQIDASARLQALASESRKVEGAILAGPKRRTVQVAVPVPAGHPVWMAVFARDVSDVHGTVTLFAARILLAGGIALLMGLIGGYLAVRRLNRPTAPTVSSAAAR
ncbi:MAG: hypothetical protein ACXVRH_02730 [Thermoleophilaceae bacterium]